jgi:hypothetical protein
VIPASATAVVIPSLADVGSAAILAEVAPFGHVIREIAAAAIVVGPSGGGAGEQCRESTERGEHASHEAGPLSERRHASRRCEPAVAARQRPWAPTYSSAG